MKFAASLTVTGLLGFLLLEALKILLAPVALWLLGAVMFVAKIAAIAFVAITAIAVSVFVYRKMNRDRESSVA